MIQIEIETEQWRIEAEAEDSRVYREIGVINDQIIVLYGYGTNTNGYLIKYDSNGNAISSSTIINEFKENSGGEHMLVNQDGIFIVSDGHTDNFSSLVCVCSCHD